MEPILLNHNPNKNSIGKVLSSRIENHNLIVEIKPKRKWKKSIETFLINENIPVVWDGQVLTFIVGEN